MIYKGGMDMLVSGRSHLSDQTAFVRNTYTKAVKADR